MSRVSERHRHLAIEANLRAHRTDAKQSLTSKGWFRGNSARHEGFFKHFKSLCVSVDPKHSEVHWAHGANYTCLPPQKLHLTLPLCPLVFINICFLLQAHSICLCILLSFEIQKTQTLTTFHHLAASLAATLHLIASSDSSDLRPCTHYQCQINLKVLTPSKSKTAMEATFQMCRQHSGLTLSFLHWKCLGLDLSRSLEEQDVEKASSGKWVLLCQAVKKRFDKLR